MSQPTPASPARPLVVRFGAMGDMVLLQTLIEALHRRFDSPVDVLSAGSWLGDLLGTQPGVGKLYLVPTRRGPYWLSPWQWRLAAQLRERGHGPTWVADGRPLARRLVRRVGVPDANVVDIRDHPLGPGEHVIDRLSRFADIVPPAFAGASDAAARPVTIGRVAAHLETSDQWRIELTGWLAQRGIGAEPLVLVQAGNKRTMRWWRPRKRAGNPKYWLEAHWARVIDGVLERTPEARVLLLGVPAEVSQNEEILQLVSRPGAINVADDLPMSRLLALQERALGMISVDTGPAHSAAALGCPLVVLFATVDPRVMAPRSMRSPVEILGGPQAGGMGAITTEAVLVAWDRMRVGQSTAAVIRKSPPL